MPFAQSTLCALKVSASPAKTAGANLPHVKPEASGVASNASFAVILVATPIVASDVSSTAGGPMAAVSNGLSMNTVGGHPALGSVPHHDASADADPAGAANPAGGAINVSSVTVADALEAAGIGSQAPEIVEPTSFASVSARDFGACTR